MRSTIFSKLPRTAEKGSLKLVHVSAVLSWRTKAFGKANLSSELKRDFSSELIFATKRLGF